MFRPTPAACRVTTCRTEGQASRRAGAAIIEALKRWAEEYGWSPRLVDWRHAGDARYSFSGMSLGGQKRPAIHTVLREFGSWHAALEAAGLTPLPPWTRVFCKHGHPLIGPHAEVAERVRSDGLGRGTRKDCLRCEREQKRKEGARWTEERWEAQRAANRENRRRKLAAMTDAERARLAAIAVQRKAPLAVAGRS